MKLLLNFFACFASGQESKTNPQFLMKPDEIEAPPLPVSADQSISDFSNIAFAEQKIWTTILSSGLESLKMNYPNQNIKLKSSNGKYLRLEKEPNNKTILACGSDDKLAEWKLQKGKHDPTLVRFQSAASANAEEYVTLDRLQNFIQLHGADDGEWNIKVIAPTFLNGDREPKMELEIMHYGLKYFLKCNGDKADTVFASELDPSITWTMSVVKAE